MVYRVTDFGNGAGIMVSSVAPPAHPALADETLRELSGAHFHIRDADRMARFAAAIANAADDDLSRDGRTLAGYPSVPALELMLDVYGFDVEEQFDWPGLLDSEPGAGLSGYSTGERVTLRCRSRSDRAEVRDRRTRPAS